MAANLTAARVASAIRDAPVVTAKMASAGTSTRAVLHHDVRAAEEHERIRRAGDFDDQIELGLLLVVEHFEKILPGIVRDRVAAGEDFGRVVTGS